MTEPVQNSSAANEVLEFLNSIEGAGYGGMASFEIARQHVREMVVHGDAQPVAWRVKNDFGHWHVTQDKALADTYRDVEKKDVQPLYHLPDLPKTVWMPIETAPKGPTISVARKGGQRDDGTTYWYQAVGHYDPNLGHFHKQYGELYGEPELWALYPENPERCSTLSHPKPPSTDS